MSSRSLRGFLAGSLVTAFLSLGGPVSGEAAALSGIPDAASLWGRAWQWLAEQIASAAEEPAAQAPPEPTAEGDRIDAGWTLDPDG